jgi:acylphosphatase
MSGTIVRHMVARGRVQGVGYRAWVQHFALARRLEGWVRNRRDGSVEAVFAGPAETVTAMIEACRHGPRQATVEAVDAEEGNLILLAERFPDEEFSVLPTV